ncbi:SusC/RagA family TonB-linked outer membrane protein [Solitalea lacus]|uniref:SusC/RagA family TonB-linked outer membrane protein n=1 Tax=Solitalea lacus TaxID=2911172 RepID=UPI001EDBBE6D|nr:SusC/RagA family TonB-linked outer membrane protein [Solitalea lacus]UKJ07082.1 SusC/RagA family TonB-linked outer membrane protein [Solitalea lacus]
MKQLLNYLWALLLCVPQLASGQTSPQGSVTGQVLAADGLPLAGASILVKGSTTGTAADGQGQFRLHLSEGSYTLVVSFIGYQTKEVSFKVPLKTALSITLTENTAQLKEVVVSTGYQHLPQTRATGSFAKVDQVQLDRVVATGVLAKLENTVSGLVVNRSAFGEPTLTIRGQSTIYGNSQPLIVVDNFPYDGDINNLNPSDVASVTVLKDAAAASIWGVRAGNGVIVITTKKGKTEEPLKMQLTSNVTVGQKPDLAYLPTISSAGFLDFERHMFRADYYQGLEQDETQSALSPAVELMIQERDGLISPAEAARRLEALSKLDVRKDLARHFFRPSVHQQYALSFKGGSKNVRYYVSGGWDNNLPSEVANHYKRMTLNSSLSFQPLKQLELGAGLNYTQSTNRLNNPGIQLLSSASAYASKRLYPYAQLADAAGNPLAVISQYRAGFVESAPASGYLDWAYRPLEDLRLAQNRAEQNDMRANVQLKYSLTDYLNAEASYQYERAFTNTTNLQDRASFATRDLINQFSEGSGASLIRNIPLGDILDRQDGQLNAQTVRGQLNFVKDWNQTHSVAALLGAEAKELSTAASASRLYGYDPQTLSSEVLDLTRSYLVRPLGYYNYIPTLRGQSEKLDRFHSFYANASYTLKDRYMLSGSGRLDQSNYFGVTTNGRSVPLWSVGGGWMIHREPFYQLKGVSKLKVRATYGYNGNIDKTVTAYTTARYSYDQLNFVRTLEIINPQNPELRWEKVGMLNVGLDFELQGKVLSGSLEYYRKNGQDLIGSLAPDPTSGVSSFRGNVAHMKGQGIDVNLNSRNLDKGLKWSSQLLFSYATDRVTDYAKKDVAYNYTQLSTGIDIYPLKGRPVYGVYSYRFAGLDAQTGDPVGYVNGEKSTNYSAIMGVPPEELVYHGPARPVYSGALRNTLNWKNFGLSFSLGYKLGYYFRRPSISYSQLAQTWSGHRDYELRWQQPGDERITTVPSLPALLNSNRDDFYLKSEVLVENASHLRLQDLNLSYALRKKQMKVLPVEHLELYLYANNLGVLWRANKQGIDPDAVPNGGASFLPAARTLAFGIRVDF